jgi:hypothetical protein
MSWEVWKWLDSGDVEFRIHSYSRLTGAANLFTRLGMRLVGQRERRRYLIGACHRIGQLTDAAVRRGSRRRAVTARPAAGRPR